MVVIAGGKKKQTEVPNTIDDVQQIPRKNLQRSAHWKIKVVSKTLLQKQPKTLNSSCYRTMFKICSLHAKESPSPTTHWQSQHNIKRGVIQQAYFSY